MADFAHGTILSRRTSTGPDVFTTIGGVLGITGPSFSAEVAETTDQSSTSSFREYISALSTVGQITFDINYDPDDATHKSATNGLIDDLKEGDIETWRIAFPDTPATERFVWTGFVAGFEVSAPVDGVLSAAITIQSSGSTSTDPS